jgi:uncharacterized protein involved in exopolysaccharide biosynthesis
MDQRQLFLRDVLTTLFKRKGQIILFALLVVVLVFVGNIVVPPVYESSAQIMLLRGRETLGTPATATLSDAPSALPMVQMTEADVLSEIQLIYSNDVLRATVEELGLHTGGSGQGASGPRAVFNGIQNAWRNATIAIGLQDEKSALEAWVDILRDAIQARQVQDSNVIDIRCRMGTAEDAQRVLQAVVENYKEKHIEVFEPEGSSSFFQNELAEARQEWTAAQERLKQFRTENGIFEIEKENELLLEQFARAKRLDLQLQELNELSGEEIDAAGPESELMQTLSRETESTVITELRLRVLEKILRRHEVMQSKGPNHPAVVAINNEIEAAWDRLNDAIAHTTQIVEAEKASLQERLEKLAELMDQHDGLVKEVELKNDAYAFFAQKVQEAVAGERLAARQYTNIRDVSSASVPTSPIRPRKLFNMLIAVIVGLVGGIALAYMREYLDHGLKTPEDVDHYLNVPLLASFFREGSGALDVGEAQRMTSLIDATECAGPVGIIEVASSTDGEGALDVARALADASADNQPGKTLLVDLSTAGPGNGFTDVVLDQAQPDECVANTGYLDTMQRGTQISLPAHLWNSEKMQEVLANLHDNYSRIVFHAPPILNSSDTLNLARIADGVVVVIKADSTRREVVMRAMESLAKSKGRVLGAVLTARKQLIPRFVYKRM